MEILLVLGMIVFSISLGLSIGQRKGREDIITYVSSDSKESIERLFKMRIG